MAIYLGNTKVSGSGVQVDSALSSTSTRPVTNAAITEALTEVGYSTWAKPTDWIDIRSSAVINSITFLVAHSTPTVSEGTYTVATYPQFKVQATVSDSDTYDVFVDGVKVATTASATVTTLDWGALYTAGTITGGYDVTYPSALTTHVVRVTPTTNTNTISAIKLDSSISQYGVLWVHFEINNSIDLSGFSGTFSSNYACPLLEAVTSTNDSLQINTGFNLRNAASLVELPVLVGQNASVNMGRGFSGCSKLKKVKLKNMELSGNSTFQSCNALEMVETDNAHIITNNNTFNATPALKKLPPFTFRGSQNGENVIVVGSALEPTVIDATNGISLRSFGAHGTSTNRADGIKGAVVSNQAPFTTSTAPHINVSYTGMSRAALVTLFNSMPTVTDSQVCNVTGCTGADDLTASDIAIVTGKGWTLTR